jgi:hemoglobin
MIPALFLAAALAGQAVPPGEQPVDPYSQSDANAGAAPFKGQAMWHAFHEQAGVNRVVDGFVDRNTSDRRIADIFKGQDLVRLRRTLKEQFCYILGGGCSYTGRDMRAGHKNLGVQRKDFNAVVENLQLEMAAEHISTFAQNRFLAKLAPMERQVVER